MRPMIRLTVAAFALSCAGSPWAHAGGMGMGRMRGPAFLRQLFPPSLIMEHQGDIELTDAQRQAITKEMTDTQKAVVDLRWQLEEKTAALTKLLGAPKVDESAVMPLADEVLKLENQMKRLRLGLLVRVKNLLTPAQQETLRKLQLSAPPMGRRGPRNGDGGVPERLEP
jgi:Spy/CpxP family protein refolding chaperone